VQFVNQNHPVLLGSLYGLELLLKIGGSVGTISAWLEVGVALIFRYDSGSVSSIWWWEDRQLRRRVLYFDSEFVIAEDVLVSDFIVATTLKFAYPSGDRTVNLPSCVTTSPL